MAATGHWTAIAVAFGFAAAGCASLEETPLAPNMARLDVAPTAPPAFPLAAGPADATLREAAALTLSRGYQFFRLTPIYGLAFNHFGVTVVMFRAGESAARGAFDAGAILAAGV